MERHQSFRLWRLVLGGFDSRNSHKAGKAVEDRGLGFFGVQNLKLPLPCSEGFGFSGKPLRGWNPEIGWWMEVSMRIVEACRIEKHIQFDSYESILPGYAVAVEGVGSDLQAKLLNPFWGTLGVSEIAGGRSHVFSHI